MSGCIGVLAAFNTADELDKVAAATRGEAAPQATLEMDSEGSGIVAAMQWAGPVKLHPTFRTSAALLREFSAVQKANACEQLSYSLGEPLTSFVAT